jgi:hypothetical protein
MKLKKIPALLYFLISLSFSVLADTYPAVVVPALTECAAYAIQIGLASATDEGLNPDSWSGHKCKLYNSSGTWVSTVAGINDSHSCPNGGTASGLMCINAPVCLTPQIRKTTSPYSCFTPVECRYPETDDGSGACSNNTCPGTQTRNPLTKECQTQPVCGSTETYDITSNTCKLYPLNCPKNSHASSANDRCLANAPLACSLGQHDDGTYTCVADNVSACTSNQQYGSINGISQCIKKTNSEQAKNDADQAKLAATLAKANADNAALVLAADPTNASKQAANAAAQGAYNEAKAQSDKAQNDQNTDTLSSIDQSLKKIDQTLIGGEVGMLPTDDILANMDTGNMANLANTGTGFMSNVIALPTLTDCQPVQMDYKSLHYTFNPCDKLLINHK